jgi:CheY-like chemotaxis protein
MKILLVDDSRVTRYALRIELQNLGIEVATAESAEAALETLKTQVPDAILMDHIMPGLNGLEALESIRADPRTAHLPIVICTSQNDSTFAEAAAKKGVLAVLPKSLATERLPEVIERIQTEIDKPTLMASDEPTPARETMEIARSSDAVDCRSEPELIALIDARLEAGLNKRLTLLIEDLRRDLTEMLTAEVRHLVEMRLAQARAESAAAPPPARLQDLQGLEQRLIQETLPDLVERRVSADLDLLKSAILDDLTQARLVGEKNPEPGASEATSYGARSEPLKVLLNRLTWGTWVADTLSRSKGMASDARGSVLSALKRLKR